VGECRNGWVCENTTDSVASEALEQLEVRTALATVSTDNGNNGDPSIETLLKEFNALIGKDFLNKYDHAASIEKLDYALAFKVIEFKCPYMDRFAYTAYV